MKQSTKFLRTSYKRFKAETPAYFKKIVVFMCGLSAAGIALLPYEDNLPAWMKGVPGYCIAIGAAGAFLSKLTATEESLKEINKEA